MILTFLILLALFLGFLGGCAVASATKPISVRPPDPLLVPLVPAVVRRKRRDVWN